GNLIRRDEVNMRVDAAGRREEAFPGEHFGRGADFHTGRNAVHDAGIACLADRVDAAVAYRDVGLVDPGVVDDEGIGDDEIGRAAGARGGRRLTHSVANHFAAAEFGLVAIDGTVRLDLDEQIGIAEPHAVADGRSVVVRVGASIDLHRASCLTSFTSFAGSSGPFVSPLMPMTVRLPPIATSSTVRVS